MTRPLLTVAIATMADRMGQLNADALTEMDGVTYHLFVQGNGHLPDIGASSRADIHITKIDGVGAAHSRNAALAAASDGILLFADDDLVFNAADYTALRDLFAKKPDLDFVCGQLRSQQGPTTSQPLARATRFNTGKVVTPEIAVRLASFRGADIRFDTDFGAGCALWLGDEYIFLCDAIRAGLRGCNVNLTFGAHPHASSGKDDSEKTFAVREMVFRRAHRPASWHWRVAFAVKSYRRFPNWHSFWRFIRP